MAIRTEHACYSAFSNVVDQMITVAVQEKGLAGLFHEAVCLMVKETGFDVVACSEAFETIVNKLTADYKEKVEHHFGAGVALSNAVPSFRQRVSEYRRGIKAGLDPTKYDTCSKYRKALNSINKPAPQGSSSGGGLEPSNSGGVPASAPMAPVQAVASKLPDNVRGRVLNALKLLESLDDAAALEVAANFEHAVYAKLRKAGGGRLAGIGKS